MVKTSSELFISTESSIKAFMPQISNTNDSNVQALIVPHAGYRYSGRIASIGFSKACCTAFDSVLILGPSHHAYFSNRIGISKFDAVQTPLGSLQCDAEIRRHLLETYPHIFFALESKVDEEEHSIEMQYPFIAHYLTQHAQKTIQIVSLVVGVFLDENAEIAATQAIEHTLKAVENTKKCLLIASSDFCHWGRRFDYFPKLTPATPISAGVEALDRLAIDAICAVDLAAFKAHIAQTANTICGRAAIAVLLRILQRRRTVTGECVAYAQSNAADSMQDSSVSYACVIFAEKPLAA